MILDVRTSADRADAAAEGARLTAVGGAVLVALSRIGPDCR
jgi:hypothetical protein